MMKKISWSCIVIGIISIGFSILNVVGVFLPLKTLNDLVRCVLPYQSIVISLSSLSEILPQFHTMIENFLSPFIGYALSIILLISAVGTIWPKPWGRIFGCIYAKSMIVLSLMSMPLIAIEYIIDDTFIWGGGLVLVYIFILLGTLFYPITLLIFFSRPRIKERFTSRGV